jgi:hypothetical protein
MSAHLNRILLAALLCLPLPALADPPKLTPQQLDFFEKHVRPVLSDNCYRCHSHDSEKLKGGLFLDFRDGVLKGGDTGPAIVPGNPDKSLLIKAIRYTDKDLQMPPSDKQLDPQQISDLEAWVKMGAPDPRDAPVDTGHKYQINFAEAAKHWSYQPVTNPPVPQPDDPDHWIQDPVDNFILATLQSKGLTPSPRADKVTLIRRATFDLIGLPPTTKEVADFVADDSTNAFATVVDRLLASPHYGERWARHWLDIAHYADTCGTLGNNRDERYPYSYVYRDWVVRAFNEGLPYDQFLIQQIAADKLDLGDDKRPLAALGFLTLGNRFNNQINDIIDDRIDIVCKGTLAMTVTCARCHDHKFDPIPTKDYYALHGIFNSSIEPKEEPLVETPPDTPAYHTFTAEYSKRERAVEDFRDDATRQLKAEMINKSGEYMLAVNEFHHSGTNLSRPAFMDKRGLNPQIAAFWDNNLKNWASRHHPVFAPWFAFAKLSDDEFRDQAADLAAKFHDNRDRSKPINAAVADIFSTPPASLTQLASRYATLFADTERQWQEQIKVSAATNDSGTAPDNQQLPDPAREQIRRIMYAPNSPMLVDEQRLNAFINRDNKMRNKLTGLERAVTDLVVNDPGSPARAPALEDAPKPKDSYVFIKGNIGNRGPVVPRHFLSILTGGNPPPFTDGSGRLDLARDIASTNNPLTARVMVNRVWLNHFGEGIVRTPDDFGARGDNPSHPELLDYLAWHFMNGGWSVKQLHRMILLSSAYQQSSDDNPRYDQIDPENRCLWRMNRRRLDFEALRDTILYIGGDLDLTMGGRPVPLDSQPFSMRRSIYGFVDRRNVPTMFQAFDFANPDLTTGRRESTVVPQQALFMMNNPLVIQQAINLVARRPDVRAEPAPQSRIKLLYNLIYQRDPTDLELNLALDYLHSDSATEWQTNAQSAWQYGYGAYDQAAHRVKAFIQFTDFASRAWRPPGGNKIDPHLRGLVLAADGGMPNKAFAVIRRWTAPRDGSIAIDGMLVHGAKVGDGVRARIVSARLGELGSWVAQGSQAATTLPRVQVKRGDLIDFIVDCRDNPDNDAFKWVPRITMAPAPGYPEGCVMAWDAQKDFSGQQQARHLTSWEKLAQVLLETNELTFVN